MGRAKTKTTRDTQTVVVVWVLNAGISLRRTQERGSLRAEAGPHLFFGLKV